jgi:hypothetical protein
MENEEIFLLFSIIRFPFCVYIVGVCVVVVAAPFVP